MIMVTADDGNRGDCESAQIELLVYRSTRAFLQPSTRNRWRRIFLKFHAYEVLTSLVRNAKNNRSITCPGVASDEDEASSYAALPTHNHDLLPAVGAAAQNPATDQLDIRLNIQNTNNNDDDDDEDEASSYAVVPTHNHDLPSAAENSATDQLDIRLNIQNTNNNDDDDDDDDGNNNDGENVGPLPPTRISVETLSSIVKDKNLGALCELGGVEGIAAAVDTSLEHGICCEAEDLYRRREEYGSNTYCPEQLTPLKSFFHFAVKAFKDWTVILLLCCAALSFASGIIEEGLKNGWYDGTTLFTTVFILVAATSIKSYWHSRKSQKQLLNKNKQVTDVLRQGQKQPISYSDIVVGDIVFLKPGDCIPADGLFINGEDLKVDDGVLQHDSRINLVENPFLYYGAKVIDGSGCMFVTSVGMNTVLGEMMRTEKTGTSRKLQKHTLQVQLDKLNNYLQNIGLSLAILILVALLLRYLLGKIDDETGYPDQISKRTSVAELMKAVQRLLTKPRGIGTSLTTVLGVLLVGIQEGLPLVITLSLSYWNEKMANDHQVRILEPSGCVTMGSVTTLFIDKTALNQIEVNMIWVGEEPISANPASIIPQPVLEMIRDGVVTPILMSDTSTSSIEDILLPWAKLSLGIDVELIKQNRTVLKVKSFGSDRKKSGLLMRKNENPEKIIHLHWRGCAETILSMCSDYYSSDGEKNAMDEGKKVGFRKVIQNMATKGLYSIAFAYRQIIEENDNGDNESITITNQLHEDNLSLLVLLGLKYPCAAMKNFQRAGVNVKLVSPENLSVLKPIAIECGIPLPEGDVDAIVLEGEQFRNFSDAEMRAKAYKITIMGNSLPSDKLLLIQWLKREGQVVAVTGARTIDTPALKEADLGILMGTNISEMAKESCDIVIANGNFASLVNVSLFGRSGYQNICKFIQLELTAQISGLLITFVTTVCLGDTPIAPLHLFLVNLIVGTLAALALLTEPPTRVLLDTLRINQTEPLVTKAMWRNILIQVCYQTVVLLIFDLMRQDILGMNRKVKRAMIFNGFSLCLVSNQFNAREPTKKNVFKGIVSSHWFLAAVGAPIILLVVVMEFGTSLTDFPRLNGVQWLVCIIFAIMSWPIDYIVKCIPNGFFTSRSIGSSWLRFISTIPPTPMVSGSPLPTPLMTE